MLCIVICVCRITVTIISQLPARRLHHVITVQTLTNHPVGPSPPSDAVILGASEFLPFMFFCYFEVHSRGARFVIHLLYTREGDLHSPEEHRTGIAEVMG